jgi:hypothetical protein
MHHHNSSVHFPRTTGQSFRDEPFSGTVDSCLEHIFKVNPAKQEKKVKPWSSRCLVLSWVAGASTPQARGTESPVVGHSASAPYDAAGMLLLPLCLHAVDPER